MGHRRGLHARRSALFERWSDFVCEGTVDGVRDEVVSSWRRSRGVLSCEIVAAPTASCRRDQEALLKHTGVLEEAASSTLRESDVVVALADTDGQIVWTGGDPALRRRAESVNYAPGALWDEGSIGVSAMSLALSSDSPKAVWSAEHWSPVLHDWSCHAAPVHHPLNGSQLGVLNLSTPWDMSHPLLGMAATVLADRFGAQFTTAEADAISDDPVMEIHLNVLGVHRATLAERELRLTRRQIEILLLMALHPAGIGLAELHADLYGDNPVGLSTLKAEVSHLRHLLGGRISRAPYRIDGRVHVDALAVLDGLRGGRIGDAVTGYGGRVLPWSESPRIVRLSRMVEVALRDAVLGTDDYESAVVLAKHFQDDTELTDHILRILPPGDGRRHILIGELAGIL